RLGDPVECVVVWNPDRLSRADSIRTSAVLARLQDAGVGRLLTASDGWLDWSDCTTRVLMMLKQDLANAGYCGTLARNVLRSSAGRGARGFGLGRRPYGSRLVAGRLEVDPVTGPVVTWLFEAYAQGTWSIRALVQELNRRGVPPASGRLWQPSSIKHLL